LSTCASRWEGGDVKVPADLKPQLPYVLWLYQMGLILFWLYDRLKTSSAHKS